MKRPTRIRALIALSVGALAVFTAASPASADETGNYFASSSSTNSSDPYTYRCRIPNGALGYCMVTSQDLNQNPIYPNDQLAKNFYPMNKTLIRYSSDGLSWTNPVATMTESYLSSKGMGTVGKHLWAPAVRFVDSPYGSWQNMYVPDTSSPYNRLYSNIYYSYCGQFDSAFQTNGCASSSYTPRIVTGGPAGAYMSDPEVFSTATNYLTNTSHDYLLWADGDNDTCGGLSIRHMASAYTLDPFSSVSQAAITINGLNVLGNCKAVDGPNAGQYLGRPYLEGGSLFDLSRFGVSLPEGTPGKYVLMFAAKPTSTPSECASSKGQPGTANEVIAYATSNSVTGPYNYQGIVMCGSSTEWTNQASIEAVTASNGDPRMVLVYHDGVSGTPKNRQLHAECLFTMDNKFTLTMRSSDGVASTSGNRHWCLQQTHIRAYTSAYNGKFVSATSNGTLKASASSIGPWEQFGLTYVGSGKYSFNSRHGSKYVAADRNTNQLIANRSSVGSWEKFSFVHVAGTLYRIKDSQGKYWHVNSNGTVVPGSTNPSSSDTSYEFYQQLLTS